LFCGKPLIWWTIHALSKTNTVDEIIVATDSSKIENIVEDFGFEQVKIYHRSPLNATDQSSTESVMLEYIESVALDRNTRFLLVQATSPFTRPEDFKNALDLFHSTQCDSILSVVENKRFFWSKNGEALNYNYKNRSRRQDLEASLMENGAFYISTVKDILVSKNRLSGKVLPYIMPEYTGLELDEPMDWLQGEAIMKFLLRK